MEYVIGYRKIDKTTKRVEEGYCIKSSDRLYLSKEKILAFAKVNALDWAPLFVFDNVEDANCCLSFLARTNRREDGLESGEKSKFIVHYYLVRVDKKDFKFNLIDVPAHHLSCYHFYKKTNENNIDLKIKLKMIDCKSVDKR